MEKGLFCIICKRLHNLSKYDKIKNQRNICKIFGKYSYYGDDLFYRSGMITLDSFAQPSPWEFMLRAGG